LFKYMWLFLAVDNTVKCCCYCCCRLSYSWDSEKQEYWSAIAWPERWRGGGGGGGGRWI